MVGPNDSALITQVERASRFMLLGRLPGTRNSATVIDMLTVMARNLPRAALRSITWDRGAEMAQHARFTAATGCPVFIADPHSPWQRPTNENFNGQLRWECPKGTDFNTISDEDIRATQNLSNTPARVVLDGCTPAERLAELIDNTQDTGALTT